MNKKKVVLISGASKGMGKDFMLQLLRDGFLVVGFSRNEAGCKVLEKELAKDFPADSFMVLSGDVTNENDLKNIVRKTVERFGSIDILINNAGWGIFGSIESIDIADFRAMYETNVVGVVALTKQVVPIMKKQKSGLVINLVSTAGHRANPHAEHYSATKFGVMGFSEGLRKELKEFGIKVSTVSPGMTQTEFFSDKELERRRREVGTKYEDMLAINDVTRVVSLICNQSEKSDIQQVIVIPSN